MPRNWVLFVRGPDDFLRESKIESMKTNFLTEPFILGISYALLNENEKAMAALTRVIEGSRAMPDRTQAESRAREALEDLRREDREGLLKRIESWERTYAERIRNGGAQ